MAGSEHRWKSGKAANWDRKVTLMRSAKTKATYKHGMGDCRKAMLINRGRSRCLSCLGMKLQRNND